MVQPDDRVPARLAGRRDAQLAAVAIAHDEGAGGIEADAGDVAGRHAGNLPRRPDGDADGAPDVLRIVLGMIGRRPVHRDLMLGAAEHGAGAVEDRGARAAGTDIHGTDMTCHQAALLRARRRPALRAAQRRTERWNCCSAVRRAGRKRQMQSAACQSSPLTACPCRCAMHGRRRSIAPRAEADRLPACLSLPCRHSICGVQAFPAGWPASHRAVRGGCHRAFWRTSGACREIPRERRPDAVLPERGERRAERCRKPRRLADVAVDVGHGEPCRRIGPGGARRRLQPGPSSGRSARSPPRLPWCRSSSGTTAPIPAPARRCRCRPPAGRRSSGR